MVILGLEHMSLGTLLSGTALCKPNIYIIYCTVHVYVYKSMIHIQTDQRLLFSAGIYKTSKDLDHQPNYSQPVKAPVIDFLVL